MKFAGVWWWFAVIYTFMVWGIGWGILCMFFPIFPIIDFVKYLVQ